MKGKEKVFIYFNLHKKVFSVRSMKSGIVIAHVTEIELDNAIFKVSEKGRQKVLSERRKNVHAGIVGFISEKEVFKSQEKYNQAIYNPYLYESFVDKESKGRLDYSDKVKLSVKNQIPKIEYK